METAIIEKILNSKTYSKDFTPAFGSYAALCLHCFDSFQIKEAFNSQSSFAVIFNGQEICRIDSEIFRDALIERKKKMAAEFLVA